MFFMYSLASLEKKKIRCWTFVYSSRVCALESPSSIYDNITRCIAPSPVQKRDLCISENINGNVVDIEKNDILKIYI